MQKRNLAEASLGASDAAAIMGAAATISGYLDTPVGYGAALVFGLGSAASWYTSNRYAELAGDPPRDDVETISLFKPQKFSFPKSIIISPPISAIRDIGNDPEQILQNFIESQFNLSNALERLKLSLERALSITTSTRLSNTFLDKEVSLERYKAIQFEAIKFNANSCVDLQNDLVKMSPTINLYWFEIINNLLKDRENINIDVNRIKEPFIELWETKILPIIDENQITQSAYDEFAEYKEYVRKQRYPSGIPVVLLEQRWYDSMKSVSISLVDLIDHIND